MSLTEEKEQVVGETDLSIDKELSQKELEEIVQANPNLKKLQLQLPYECKTNFDFDDLQFPNLETLKLDCINMNNGINFKNEKFPKLTALDIMNINIEKDEGCDFDFILPQLKKLSIQHVECMDQKKFAASISKCVKLESFSCYKFRVYGGLKQLALLNVELFAMSRAEGMTGLSIWAPKLKQLILRSNWDLKSVNILSSIPKTFDKHNNKVKIPKGKYSSFDVKLIYCDPKIKADENRIKSIEKIEANDY
eukprot:279545_1